MSNSKHPKTQTPSDRDLLRNPGIGESKGTTMAGAAPEEIEADSTVEGDVVSETNAFGGVDPDHRGRTNK